VRAALLGALLLALTARVVAQTPAPETVRVSFVPVADAIPFYYAWQNGLFAKAGLDLKVDIAGSGSLSSVAVTGGADDIGGANLFTITLARSKGIPLTVIAPQALYEASLPSTQILVAADSPLKTAKDLEGHTVAVAGLRDLMAAGTSLWMTRNGADPSAVHFVEANQPTMLVGLQAKRFDAIVSSEPALGNAIGSGNARVFASPFDAIAPRFIVDALFATAPWLATHREAALKFARVMHDATVYTNGHREEMIPLISAYTKITPEVLRRMRPPRNAESLNPAWIQPVIDAAAKYGDIPKSFPAKEMLLAGAP
jgi:NitT/TauT family transport system substrate-binding protein